MNTKKITFNNQENLTLSAEIQLPLQKPLAYALFAHCFTCNKNFKAVQHIAEALTSMGFAVLLFDFAGLGSSEGDFQDTNFSSNIEDLVTAAEYMQEHWESPSLLIGHSLGGAAVIQAAHHISSVKAIATIGAPSSPDHVTHLFDEQLEEINRSGKATVNIGGRPFTIKKQFIDDIGKKDKQASIKQLKRALLILHSPQDNIVGINNAAEIYEQAMHPKSFISLDKADHLLTNKDDSLYAGKVIAQWAERYLELSKAPSLQTHQQVVAQIGKDSYTTHILAGQHPLLADEPEDVGGDNLGPTPYELLLASLGACTVMTLRMYADRKEWPLEEVEVHLSHKKDYAEDCKEAKNDGEKIDFIEREITLKGDLNKEQRERLLEISNKCPVHKTLTSTNNITTKLL
ncbi:bifunctional alpha/beta hydrolase/OsmC family protein [Algivirga pacifica]|uniref:Bifunctional alpha/beta hydrolase/OsmC family protein n=1 Tax=Algivirga pacifica TaxID=1162670 RepID=A0ABP9DAL9_9BACT